jgi:hypothetical protein
MPRCFRPMRVFIAALVPRGPRRAGHGVRRGRKRRRGVQSQRPLGRQWRPAHAVVLVQDHVDDHDCGSYRHDHERGECVGYSLEPGEQRSAPLHEVRVRVLARRLHRIPL